MAHGRTVVGVNGKKVGPGEIVKVPKDEVELLTKLGFLADGDVIEKPQTGPHISVASGPTVRIA
ncbi:hypothetical protein HBO43_22400 [Pseudomonas veronii]|uniref:Uncharacterized protein n=1 Tax=Pseudomonas veronii TaxID=76761 RepID=A0A7Y0ZWL6_PSEVE|nr:hypothetical protein [Pseudomonas veronii]NMX99345.1 hypothetical protein [Pseudomonas veronii]UHH28299.1 hypothetical protein LUW10_20795 [Pseudomonas veronii]